MLRLKIAVQSREGMSLGIVIDLKKYFDAAKLRHWSRKITKFSTHK